MADSRIYVVTRDVDPVRLVRATNKAHALRYIATEYRVDVASQDDLVEAVGHGIKVEDATPV